jgi:hypothetical protein
VHLVILLFSPLFGPVCKVACLAMGHEKLESLYPSGAGNFGRSAAVGQILPPKPQMVVKQDWRYVSGGGQVAYHAHARDCEVTSLAFSADDNTLLSRATDNTLKVFFLSLFFVVVVLKMLAELKGGSH